MYYSEQFDKVDMTNWEKKAATNKMGDNAKTYFQAKYKEKVMYCKATAQNMGYANNMNELNAALMETLKILMEVMQNEQANAAVETTNKFMQKTIEQMMENQKQMTAMIEKLATKAATRPTMCNLPTTMRNV